MRMLLLPALTAIAVGAFCGHANAQAQAQCPELVRLRNAAQDAQKPFRGLYQGSCVAYIRLADAWSAVVEYAGENREMCSVSEDWLRAYEVYRREAARVRDNICAGRPARAFPAEIIRQ